MPPWLFVGALVPAWLAALVGLCFMLRRHGCACLWQCVGCCLRRLLAESKKIAEPKGSPPQPPPPAFNRQLSKDLGLGTPGAGGEVQMRRLESKAC